MKKLVEKDILSSFFHQLHQLYKTQSLQFQFHQIGHHFLHQYQLHSDSSSSITFNFTTSSTTNFTRLELHHPNLQKYLHQLHQTTTITTHKLQDQLYQIQIHTSQDETKYQVSLDQTSLPRLQAEELVTSLLMYALLQVHPNLSLPVQDALAQVTQHLPTPEALQCDHNPVLSGLDHLFLKTPEIRTATVVYDKHKGPCTLANVPYEGLIMPGSYNPMHEGHQSLAKVAQSFYGFQHPLMYEISIANADKGLIDRSIIEDRIRQIQQLQLSAAEAVVITTSMLFYEKAILFPKCIFVIGADTAVRLVNPKYYGDRSEAMLLALSQIKFQQCKFLVAGRKVGEEFLPAQAVLDRIPEEYHSMFDILKEDDFRMDISSTEIRQRQQQTSS